MNDVVFQLAIVFAPGLIWTIIVDKLCTKGEERSTVRMVIRAFGFGIASYFVYFTIYYLGFRLYYQVWPTLLDQVKTVTGVSDLRAIRPRDILGASVLSPILAILWSSSANRKHFSRAMQRLGVTRKFGDEGVWEYAFNMGTPAAEYINIRDFEKRVVYSGFVKAFSEGGNVRELLLDEARVFDLETGQKLFEMPAMYLSRKLDSMDIEFPYDEKKPRNDKSELPAKE